MKILLTGEPHVGKSTALYNIVANAQPKRGFITQELLHDGSRTGFQLVSDIGDTAVLASTDSLSHTRVSRYGVNVATLDSFIDQLKPVESGDLLYIDEIGQMELFSEAFKGLVNTYLNSKNDFIGTLTSVYEDDFIADLRARHDVEIINLTMSNRDEVARQLGQRVAKYTS